MRKTPPNGTPVPNANTGAEAAVVFRKFDQAQAEAEFQQHASGVRRAVEHYEAARSIPQHVLEAEVCL